jgi:hypothetical protein
MLMEECALSEQNEQGLSVEVVQTPQKEIEKPKKKRSQSDKVGTNKYNQQLLKRSLTGIEDIKTELRWIRNELSSQGLGKYSQSDIEHFTAPDEVDKEIIQRLLEVGVNGALPKDVAAEVNKRTGYNLKYYEVSRRLLKLNKKLRFETSNALFEKRGHRWALSRFGFKSYGANEFEDLRQEASTAALVPCDRDIKEEESSAW